MVKPDNVQAAPKPAGDMSLREAWRSVQAALVRAGIEDAPFDAAQLVQHVTGLVHRLHPDAKLSPAQAAALHALAQRRAAHEPLQYLLGAWDFLDFTLRVGRGVLIPRADTEIVCETAIAAVQRAAATLAHPRVVDLCAGSGAIAVGVARAVPQADVTAVELSDDAFFYLRENAAALAPQIALVKADVFTWQDTLPRSCVDVLVSNPPYIAPDEMGALAPELSFEPRMALEAAENGLAFYRHIARAYRSALRPGGALVFEIGSAQAQQVCGLLRENGYSDIEVLTDAANLPRCVTARAPEELH